MSPSSSRALARDAALIALSIFIAVLAFQTDTLSVWFTASPGLFVLGSVCAGLLFSSVFTLAPAIALIGHLTAVHHPWEVAALGSVGAVVGNLFVYRLFRGRVSHELNHLLTRFGHRDWLRVLRDHHFRWLSVLAACVVIVTPLPDEIGVALLGLSQTPPLAFVLVAYATNAVGMLLVGLAFRLPVGR